MTETKHKPSAIARRSAARLMAVQAVYQAMIRDLDVQEMGAEYLAHHQEMVVEGETMVKPDESLFSMIVGAVHERRQDLEEMVVQGRDGQGVSDPLLKAVLLCGIGELLVHPQADAPIIISDFVDVTKAFYDQKEPSLVNAVLDKLAKILRA